MTITSASAGNSTSTSQKTVSASAGGTSNMPASCRSRAVRVIGLLREILVFNASVVLLTFLVDFSVITPRNGGRVSKFDFVVGDDFRKSLEADYAELRACLEHEAWKAAQV